MDKAMRKKGIITLVAAIAIQLCLGVAYIWGVFQTGIADSIFSGDNAKSALTFSLLLATLSIGSVVGGKLAAKWSTRVVVIIGGVILSLGFFCAGFVTASAGWLLWLTIGVMGGVGMGFTYSTTIALAQKWFPEKKGLVTGIIVSALGFGGVIFTPMVEALIEVFGGKGVGEGYTFMVLSGIFLVVCTLGGLAMSNPPESDESVVSVSDSSSSIKRNYSTKEMFCSPKYYIMVVTFALACMGGLMMIGFASPIAVAKDMAQYASLGVMLISIFNALGRLFWGIVGEKIGKINTIVILLVGSGILSLLVNLATGAWIFILIGGIGFFYGGLLSNFPVLTAEVFGAKNVAVNYGFVLLGFGVGAIVSSQIAGYYKDIAVNNIDLMFPAFIIAASCALVAVMLILLLKFLMIRENKSQCSVPEAIDKLSTVIESNESMENTEDNQQ